MIFRFILPPLIFLEVSGSYYLSPILGQKSISLQGQRRRKRGELSKGSFKETSPGKSSLTNNVLWII
jgi:hypothetical protein